MKMSYRTTLDKDGTEQIVARYQQRNDTSIVLITKMLPDLAEPWHLKAPLPGRTDAVVKISLKNRQSIDVLQKFNFFVALIQCKPDIPNRKIKSYTRFGSYMKDLYSMVEALKTRTLNLEQSTVIKILQRCTTKGRMDMGYAGEDVLQNQDNLEKILRLVRNKKTLNITMGLYIFLTQMIFAY
jgi:hypothetical protein